MKVIHIESGLGNQMLSYCEYLVLRKLHPDEPMYIETLTYDCPEANNVIKQWNGYELERVFGIKEPANLKTYFSEEQWSQIIDDIRASQWWNRYWNYPVHFTNAFRRAGLDLKNIRGDFEANPPKPRKKIKAFLKDTKAYNTFRRIYCTLFEKRILQQKNLQDVVFYKGEDDVFTGQWLAMTHRNNGIEFIEEEIRETFVFPPLKTEKNIELAKTLESCNSVAIHARRGDAMADHGYTYKFGYFKRAVRYIKNHVENPVFVMFSNTDSINWCKEHPEVFDFDFNKDKVIFVDWNVGEESYRDMQLMGMCKHAIISGSTFGTWGAFFIKNPNKITISPVESIAKNTTHHC